MTIFDEAPAELVEAVKEFWPEVEWENALRVAQLESGFNAFALHDSTSSIHPCGAPLGRTDDGILITAERSVGYFQINACNVPHTWEWQRLYNARHNAGTAHMLWEARGWQPWLFSARSLGLLPA